MDLKKLIYRIHFSLPPEQLKKIVVHSSFEPQPPTLRNSNMNYYELGKSVVSAAYALYLFNKDFLLTNSKLSLNMLGSTKKIEIAIYNDFMLEEFVIKNKDEQDVPHTDIAIKLVALIFINYGFIYCYKFLCFYFREIRGEEPIDYKETVLKIAKKKNQIPSYEITNESSDSIDYYTCKVSIGGKKTAIAYTCIKAEAKNEAAKQYILQNKSFTGIKKKNELKSLVPGLSAERKEELSKVYDLLAIKDYGISKRLLDLVMTHHSYINGSSNQKCTGNSCLSAVGFHVLKMYCSAYIIDKSTSCADYIKKRNKLIKEDNLALTIPDECISYLLADKAYNDSDTASHLKAKIIKRLIGVMMYNFAIAHSNTTLVEKVKNYTYSMFSTIERGNKFNYKAFLQDIIELFHLGINYTYESSKQSTTDKHICICKVEVTGNGWVENEKGSGQDEEAATNDAAKYILPLLVPYCSYDRQVKDTILYVISNGDLLKSKDRIKIKFSQKGVTENVHQNNKDNTSNLSNHVSKETIIPKNVSFDNNENTLYICKGTVSCNRQGHTIISSTGILASLDGEPIKINTNYCLDCQLYFINYHEYEFYRNIYGVLLGNFSIQNNLDGHAKGYHSLADESILHMCGYNVSQTKELSSDQRRLILANLMDREIVSKNKIMDYLQYFIMRSESNFNLFLAVQKWSEDLDWVHNYNINTQRRFIISSIKKYNRRK